MNAWMHEEWREREIRDTFSDALRGMRFEALKLLIFADPHWDLLLKLGFLGFKDNGTSFFEP